MTAVSGHKDCINTRSMWWIPRGDRTGQTRRSALAPTAYLNGRMFSAKLSMKCFCVLIAKGGNPIAWTREAFRAISVSRTKACWRAA